MTFGHAKHMDYLFDKSPLHRNKQRVSIDDDVPEAGSRCSYRMHGDGKQTPSSCQGESRNGHKHGHFIIQPETYDGSSSFEQYLSHFSDCAELADWDQRTKTLVLAANLRGAARKFYMGLREGERRDINVLSSRLRSRFDGNMHPYYWLHKLETRVRGSDETLADLADDLMLLAQKAHCDLDRVTQERFALNQFYKSVPVDMKCRCIDRHCCTVYDAVSVIQRYESIFAAESKAFVRSICHRKRTEKQFETKADIQDSPKLVKMKKAGSSSATFRTRRHRKLFFRCKSPNHIVRDCKRKRKRKLRRFHTGSLNKDFRGTKSFSTDVHTIDDSGSRPSKDTSSTCDAANNGNHLHSSSPIKVRHLHVRISQPFHSCISDADKDVRSVVDDNAQPARTSKNVSQAILTINDPLIGHYPRAGISTPRLCPDSYEPLEQRENISDVKQYSRRTLKRHTMREDCVSRNFFHGSMKDLTDDPWVEHDGTESCRGLISDKSSVRNKGYVGTDSNAMSVGPDGLVTMS